jgi:hypothetical protein
VKRFLAWIAGGLAVYRLVKRRRLSAVGSPPQLDRPRTADPRAEALRAKLETWPAATGSAEQDTPEPVEPEPVEPAAPVPDVGAETASAEPDEQLLEPAAFAAAEVTPPTEVIPTEDDDGADPDKRRRGVQEHARAALEQMRGPEAS